MRTGMSRPRKICGTWNDSKRVLALSCLRGFDDIAEAHDSSAHARLNSSIRRLCTVRTAPCDERSEERAGRTQRQAPTVRPTSPSASWGVAPACRKPLATYLLGRPGKPNFRDERLEIPPVLVSPNIAVPPPDRLRCRRLDGHPLWREDSHSLHSEGRAVGGADSSSARSIARSASRRRSCADHAMPLNASHLRPSGASNHAPR